MAQTSCRLTESLNKKYEDAATERGVFKSELVREAMRYYARQNPRGLETFGGRTSKTGRKSKNGRGNGPKTEGERQPKPPKREKSGPAGDRRGESSVYDPSKEMEDGAGRKDAE
jgi:hypothetical protein